MPEGAGKAGYCTLCARPEAKVYIDGARAGWSHPKASEMAAQFDFVFSRQTWYRHKAHAETDEQKVIQRAVAVRKEGLLPAKFQKSTNQGFLEAVRDIGMARAALDPDSISIDHALKAVSILEAKKEKKSDALNVFVNFMIGAPPAYTIIDGEAREVEGD